MIDFKARKIEEEKKFLATLSENLNLKKAEESLGKFLGAFFVLRLLTKETILSEEKFEKKLCRLAKATIGVGARCMHTAKDAVEKCARSGKMELFECPSSGCGFAYALRKDGAAFAYLLGCRLKDKPPKAYLELFGYFVETILANIQKEMQLEEINKTVKPRALALSTVHTVHRLISSSLYLDELLSRVARLSMQIIKAERCSIKLVDSKKKTLLPKTTVDYRKKKTTLKKVKIGRWAPGKAVKYGKSIMAGKYLATPLIDEDIIGVITLYDKKNGKPFDNFDLEIMRTLAEQAAIAIKNAQLYKEQEKLTMGSIRALAQIIESRGTGICTPKTSFLKIVHLIGQNSGMSEHELKILQYAALLHDAGELMLPEGILRKKGKLTHREYRLIKEHPLKGAKIIKSLKSLKSVAPIIMHHHENFNGTGYPKGLKGKGIPLGARIMGVVGAFEAMITKRPYRVSFSIKRAIEEIKKNSGKQFDPTIVAAFLKAVKRKDVISIIKHEACGHRKQAH